MSENKDTSTHYDDDDFQFDEDFDAPASKASSDNSAKPKDPLFNDMRSKITWDSSSKNSRKIIILALAVVIIIFFIIYHFASNWSNSLSSITHFSEEKSRIAKAAAPTAAQIAAAQQAEKNAADKLAAEAQQAQAAQVDQTLNQQQQTINQLQGNINSLQDSVSSLSATVTTMSQQLDAINSKLTKPVVKRVKPATPEEVPVQYTIHAIVPGGAWVHGSDGSSTFLTPGSSVPKHGTVTSIDLNSMEVTTSDGTVIPYDMAGSP
jgi:hypothetical protein